MGDSTAAEDESIEGRDCCEDAIVHKLLYVKIEMGCVCVVCSQGQVIKHLRIQSV